MRILLIILAIMTSQLCFSQELDIFQNDSIYSKNKIAIRTMFSLYKTKSKKELVTHYNSAGKMVKQFSYWNGEQAPHNVETFLYSKDGLISNLIDSFAEGNVQTTNYYYENGNLKQQLTLNQNYDTCDFRSYPYNLIKIQRWYLNGKPYRYDTTIFEKENIKSEYFGSEYPLNSVKSNTWHYKFFNQFDSEGNLIKVSSNLATPFNSFTVYIYDNRNLLIRKREVFYQNGKEIIQSEFYFTYE